VADNLSFNIVVNGTETAERNVSRVGGAFKQLADDAEKAQKSGDLGPTLKDVETNAEAARVRVEELGKEFEKTNSLASFNGLKDAEKDLSKLQGLAKDMRAELEKALGDNNNNGQPGFLRRLLEAFSPANLKQFANKAGNDLSKALGDALTGSNGIWGYAIPGLVVAAPVVGEMLGAAIITGIGLAGIGAGIVGQLHDQQVQAAAKDLGAELSKGFADATASFRGPLISAIGEIGVEFQKIQPGLTSMFSSLAPSVLTLERGVSGFIDTLVPGLENAARAAEPLIATLSQWLPQLGSELGSMFSDFSRNEKDADQALRMLLGTIDLILGQLRIVENVGQFAFKWLVPEPTKAFFNWLSAHGKQAGTDTAAGIEQAAMSVDDLAAAQKRDTEVTRQWEQALNDSINTIANLDQATANWKHDLANLKSQLDLHHRSLNDATDAGHKNADSLRQMAQEADRVRQAAIAQAGGEHASAAAVAEANAKYNDNIRTLEALAIKAGFSASQVHALLDQYLLVEHQPDITKNININTIYSTITNRPRGAGQSNNKGYASGGSVLGGEPIVVGEHQPEIFVPDTAGTIMPSVNSFLGAGGGTLSIELDITHRWPDGRITREQLIRNARQRGFKRVSQLFPELEFA
jgi:hypothetical protein